MFELVFFRVSHLIITLCLKPTLDIFKEQEMKPEDGEDAIRSFVGRRRHRNGI